MPEENQNKIKKIVVGEGTELTDLIKQIGGHNGDKIILTFVENSDLLVSAVNFKVLLETADELEKVLVAQIVQNPAGQRNAVSAGMTVTSSTGQIQDQLWIEAYEKMEDRRHHRGDTLRSSQLDHPLNLHSHNHINSVDQMSASITAASNSAEHSAEIVDNSGSSVEGDKAESAPLSQFQQKVRTALDRSKKEISGGLRNRTVNQGGVTVALDHSIDRSQQISAPRNSSKLIGRDFLSPKETAQSQESSDKRVLRIPAGSKFGSDRSPKAFIASSFAKISALLKGKNYKKILLIIGLPLVLITLIIGYFIYTLSPFVKVDIYIESRPVETELTFTGDPSVTQFDLEEKKVPVKKETIEKELSDSTQATGIAVRGEKAGGVVRILCFLDSTPSITIEPGTLLTDEGGKQFVTLGQTIVECPGQQSATVEATQVGPDYNLSSGARFTVTGYNFADVNGTNLTSFSGGTEDEYTVVSEGDYNNLIKDISDTAYAEARGELERKASDGWELISSTIKDEVVGDPVVDAAVGTETDVLNATVKTKSTALYYKKSELESVASELLLQSAQEQNLFESEDQLQLKLDENIVSEVAIESIDQEGSTVTAIIKASGTVKPEVDKKSISGELDGRDWEEGIRYLGTLAFVSKPTDVKFTPEWFPESLRYFPSRQGRTQVTIHEVEATVESDQSSNLEGAN